MANKEDAKQVDIAWIGSVLSPVLHRAFKKEGVSREDVQALFNSAGDRAVDARALIHGGQLSTGEIVEGIVATDRRLDRIEAMLEELTTALHVVVAGDVTGMKLVEEGESAATAEEVTDR